MKQVETVIENIEKREWSEDPYKRQSWGSWLHRISPYVGRIKPAFAHFLIEYSTNKGDCILDPFGGIGTIPAEAMLMGRNSISNDLNPYAYTISRAKAEPRKNINELIEYINSINVNTSEISIDDIPEWVKNYYNEETLKEIMFFKKTFENDNQYFLLGNLIGISQGHRPGHLSKPCGWTLPYKPRPDDPGEYREVKPRLIEKIKRTYKDDYHQLGKMHVLYGDARKLDIPDHSVDHIISSPPYFDTLDYINSSRLRLAICGYYDVEENKDLRNNLIQKYDTYLEEMDKCISEFNRVMKDKGYCIIVVGDVFKGKKHINTAEQLVPIFAKHHFKCHAIIMDGIPINKSVQKTTSEQKYDRIMILTKEEND